MKRPVALVSATVLLAYLAAVIIIQARGKRFEEPSPPRSPAAQVVGVVFYDDDGESRSARVARGVERLKSAQLHQLIFVGGWRPASGYLGARVMYDEALSQGAPVERLRYDLRSNDTYSNLRSALSMLPAGTSGIDVISDPLHLARIAILLDRAGYAGSVGYVPSKAPESFPTHWRRINHELAAYLFMLLPRSFSEAMIDALRSSQRAASGAAAAATAHG